MHLDFHRVSLKNCQFFLKLGGVPIFFGDDPPLAKISGDTPSLAKISGDNPFYSLIFLGDTEPTQKMEIVFSSIFSKILDIPASVLPQKTKIKLYNNT